MRELCNCIGIGVVHNLSPEVVLLHNVLLKTDPVLNHESRVIVPGASKENVTSVYTMD